MKKLVRISILLFSIMMLLTMTSNAFTAETSVDTDNIKVGEDVVYKVKSDEKVIATNFDISYNEKSFELVESMTPGLNVAKKDGKIACIYFDMEQNGLDEFKVKFKGVDGYQEATFNVENAKFRVASQKESYTVKNTSGLDEQNVKVTVTGMTRLMWLAIIGTGVIIMEAIILLVVGILKSKKQLKISKKLMSIILAVLMLGTLGSSVKATESDMVINFSKIGEEKIVQVMLSKDDSDRKVTKEEIIAKNNTITSIKNANGEELAGSDIVKTGDKIQTTAGTSTVVLLGDANKDGYICDTDDIMIIVNHYLGRVEIDNITKIAANLYNSDEILDTDDIMQMMNMYLGRLEGELLTTPIENNTESEKDNVSLSLYVHSNETRYALSGRTVKVVELDSSRNEMAGTEKTYVTNENGWAKIELEMTKEERKHYKIIDITNSADYYIFTIAYDQNHEKYLINTIESSISYEISNDTNIKLYVHEGTQTNTLASVAKFGDLVNYPGGDNIQWRVWKNDGENVMLLSTNEICTSKYHFAKLVLAYEEEGKYNGTNGDVYKVDWDETVNNVFTKYKETLDTTYAKELTIVRNSDYNAYNNTSNTAEKAIFDQYFKGSYWSCDDTISNHAYARTDNGSMSEETGVRPVVILKSGILTSGQGANGWELIAQ